MARPASMQSGGQHVDTHGMGEAPRTRPGFIVITTDEQRQRYDTLLEKTKQKAARLKAEEAAERRDSK